MALTAFSLVEATRTLIRVRDAVVPGVFYNLKLRVMRPLPDAARDAGIHLGDRLVAIDGRPLADPYALADDLRRIGVDHAIRLEVAGADGRDRIAELATFAPIWPTAWFLFAVGLTFALVGIAVFWFHPGRRESWPFLFGCVAWGVAALSGLGIPRIVGAVNAVSLAAIIAIVVWRLRRPAPREDTTRLRALIVAVLLAFPVPVLLVIARELGLTSATEATKWLSNGTAVLFPLIVGHAILRRDLFEIDRAVARAAAASAIVGIVALLAVGVAVALPALVAPDSVVGSPSAMAIVVLGGVAMLWPLKQRVQCRLLDRFGRPDLDEPMAAARAALGELAEVGEPALFGRFERRLEEVIDVDDAALLLPEDAGWRRPATGEQLARSALPIVVELRLRGELVGALGVGRPGARVALSPRAARIVDVLSPEIARALRSRHTGDKIGDYRIERFLAAGGMGNVYIGAKLGAAGFVKAVAIKQLLPELAVDPAAVERFLTEARLVARLSHPGIVQTLELGETERGYFIAMEYVQGVDAATLMRRLKRRRERLPLPVAAQAVTSICHALDHVHRACDDTGAPLALIHHDVSPHNVLIDGDGNLKLADFGVAHMRHDASLAGRLVGKTGYVSPEQIAGLPYDHRIDVFAAGIVLYELVTFQHPFARGSDEATLRATEHGRYLPPETLREDCPDALAHVIARALAPVERRYATAAELADAIQRVYSLDSRHAADLGRLVRSVEVLDPKASASMPAATLTLPTMD